MLIHHSLASPRTTLLFAFQVNGDVAALEEALCGLKGAPVFANAVITDVDGVATVCLLFADDLSPCGWPRAAVVEAAAGLVAALEAPGLSLVPVDPLAGGLAQRVLLNPQPDGAPHAA